MEFILINLIFTTIVLAAFVASHRVISRGWQGVVSVSAFVLLSCVVGPAVLLQVLVLGVLAVSMPPTIKARTRGIVGGTVTLLVFGAMSLNGSYALTTRHELRKQFPIQSLSKRLEFESAIVADPESTFAQAYGGAIEFAPEVSQRLEDADHDRGFDRMRWQLRSLHEDETTAFALAAGFGFGRFRPPVLTELEPLQLDPLPPLPESDDESFIHIDGHTIRRQEPTDAIAATESDPSVPTFALNPSVLRSLHFESAENFIPEGSLGYIPGKQQAAGFLAHRFARPLAPLEAPDRRGNWQVVKLELVSLLKFTRPRVYVSKELPQMEQLKTVPTRPLDEFEETSLAKLWRDESVVIADDSNRIRMLGALRATKQCLDCHSVQRGQLLGAFSYDLQLQRGAR